MKIYGSIIWYGCGGDSPPMEDFETSLEEIQTTTLGLKEGITSGKWKWIICKEDLPELEETIKKLKEGGSYGFCCHFDGHPVAFALTKEGARQQVKLTFAEDQLGN
jgi:hypothetical protein